jgi:hypothetical protein
MCLPLNPRFSLLLTVYSSDRDLDYEHPLIPGTICSRKKKIGIVASLWIGDRVVIMET